MGGRRGVSIIFYRPVTRSDLKQERSFFRGSVSSFLQLVDAIKSRPFNARNFKVYGSCFKIPPLIHQKSQRNKSELTPQFEDPIIDYL